MKHFLDRKRIRLRSRFKGTKTKPVGERNLWFFQVVDIFTACPSLKDLWLHYMPVAKLIAKKSIRMPSSHSIIIKYLPGAHSFLPQLGIDSVFLLMSGSLPIIVESTWHYMPSASLLSDTGSLLHFLMSSKSIIL